MSADKRHYSREKDPTLSISYTGSEERTIVMIVQRQWVTLSFRLNQVLNSVLNQSFKPKLISALV